MVGPAVEIAVAQPLPIADHGRGLGSAGRLRGEALVQHARAQVLDRCLVPLPGELMTLLHGEQRQVGQTPGRLRDRSRKQRCKVADDPRRCRLLEQVGVVLQHPGENRSGFERVEHEVELRRLPARPYRPQLQARQLHRLGIRRCVLELEEHLEQRRAREIPFRLQLRNQLLEWQVLVGVGPKG